MYSTFVVEQRHGFNKQTPAFYAKDQLKKFLVGQLIQAPILAGIIKARRPHFTTYCLGITFFKKKEAGGLIPVLRNRKLFNTVPVPVPVPVPAPNLDHKNQFSQKNLGKKSCVFNDIRSSIVVYKLFISSFVIPFYYGFGSSSGSGTTTETETGTVIDYGSGSAKAKRYVSYGSGSATQVFPKVLYELLIYSYHNVAIVANFKDLYICTVLGLGLD